MAREIIYDTRSLSAVTEQQFFHEGRAKHADREIGTNMIKDALFGKDITIKKILVQLPTILVSSASAADTTLINQLKILVDEGVLELQIGEGKITYIPLSRCLSEKVIEGFFSFAQATAANASYGIATAQSISDEKGLEVEVPVKMIETIKMFLKTKTPVTYDNIRIILEIE